MSYSANRPPVSINDLGRKPETPSHPDRGYNLQQLHENRTTPYPCCKCGITVRLGSGTQPTNPKNKVICKECAGW